MTEIDLRGIFDDCYGGYRDFAAEISLRWDPATGHWTDDSVAFWKDDATGWRYQTATGEWNYGYDSLRDAVIRFSIGLTAAQREGHEFCAHSGSSSMPVETRTGPRSSRPFRWDRAADVRS